MITFGNKTVAALTAAVALQLDASAFDGATLTNEPPKAPTTGAQTKAPQSFGAQEAQSLYQTLAPSLRCNEDLLPKNPKILVVHFAVNHGDPEDFQKLKGLEQEILPAESSDEKESDMRTIARGVVRLTRHFRGIATVPFLASEGATNGAPALKSVNFVGGKLHSLQSKSEPASIAEAKSIEEKLLKEPNWLSAAATLAAGRAGLQVHGIEAKDVAGSIRVERDAQETMLGRTLAIRTESLSLTAELFQDRSGTNTQLQARVENWKTRAKALADEIESAHQKGRAANDVREDENIPVIVEQALAAQKGSELIVIPLIFGGEHNFKNNFEKWNIAHPETAVAYLQFNEVRAVEVNRLDLFK